MGYFFIFLLLPPNLFFFHSHMRTKECDGDEERVVVPGALFVSPTDEHVSAA